MFLRHKPEDGSETLYEFRPSKVDSGRAAIAEKLYSKACGERRTWEQFVADATNGSIAARKVALWLAITDVHHTARFEDIPVFKVGELGMEYSKEELRRMRAAIEGSDMLENEKRVHLAQLEEALERAPAGSDEPAPPVLDVEDEPVPGPGKDEPSDEPSTN